MTLVVTILTVLLNLRLFAQSAAPPPGGVFNDGEELVYNVRYGPLDLGQVKIQTLSSWNEAGRKVYHCRGYIDSYKGIPFVSLHAIYESVMDSSIFSIRFSGKTKDGDHWNFGKYIYDPSNNRTLIEMGAYDSVVAKRETLMVNTPVQDGLSLFFCARQNLFADKSISIPCIVSEQLLHARIDFKNERESVEVDAVDHPIDVLHFQGNAEFVGLYGMTGDFEGWFSNDEARVPILAKMHVFIGSVTIELMSWKRPGWNPPRAKG